MTRTEQAQVRKYVLNSRDVEKVRITHEGDVHALGTMPNSNVFGWYLYGYGPEILANMREEEEMRRERA